MSDLDNNPNGDGVGNTIIIDDTTNGSANSGGYKPDSGETIINPGSAGTGGTDPEPRRRRGRPPGSGSASRPAKTSATKNLDIDGVTAILLSGHSMLAAITKVPEFELDQSEASKLSKGIGNVARHYDIAASQKSIDIANLVMILAAVYGSRIMAMRMRKMMEKTQSKTPPVNHPEILQ